MNSDTLAGSGTKIGGKIKEALGDATGDRSVQGEGIVDQVSGTFQKTFGQARDAAGGNVAPLLDEVKRFARERPFAAAAAVGIVAIGLLNSLRSKA